MKKKDTKGIVLPISSGRIQALSHQRHALINISLWSPETNARNNVDDILWCIHKLCEVCFNNSQQWRSIQAVPTVVLQSLFCHKYNVQSQ